MYDICVQTADAGVDARGRYTNDRLVGDTFAAPYVHLEPEHAYVLDDGDGRAVGYVLGTADTVWFVTHYRREWIPTNADRCPVPPDPPVTPDEAMLALHHNRSRCSFPRPPTTQPIYISVLSQWQGRGWGRRLMASFLDNFDRRPDLDPGP